MRTARFLAGMSPATISSTNQREILQDGGIVCLVVECATDALLRRGGRKRRALLYGLPMLSIVQGMKQNEIEFTIL